MSCLSCSSIESHIYAVSPLRHQHLKLLLNSFTSTTQAAHRLQSRHNLPLTPARTRPSTHRPRSQQPITPPHVSAHTKGISPLPCPAPAPPILSSSQRHTWVQPHPHTSHDPPLTDSTSPDRQNHRLYISALSHGPPKKNSDTHLDGCRSL